LAYEAGEQEEEFGNSGQARDQSHSGQSRHSGASREAQEARQVFEEFRPALGAGAEHGTHVQGMAAAAGNVVGEDDEEDADEEAVDGEEVLCLWGCMSCDDVMRVHVLIRCMCVSFTLHSKPLTINP